MTAGEQGDERQLEGRAYHRVLAEAYAFIAEKALESEATREGLYYTEAAEALDRRLRQCPQPSPEKLPPKERNQEWYGHC